MIIIGLLPSTAVAADEEVHQKITIKEAQSLTYQALGIKPDGSLDYDPKGVFKRFYGFQGLGPEAGTYGFFSVNVWTGDVWSGWGCKRISNPTLEQAQAEIKKRFTPEEMKQYSRLHSLKPECLYP